MVRPVRPDAARRGEYIAAGSYACRRLTMTAGVHTPRVSGGNGLHGGFQDRAMTSDPWKDTLP